VALAAGGFSGGGGGGGVGKIICHGEPSRTMAPTKF